MEKMPENLDIRPDPGGNFPCCAGKDEQELLVVSEGASDSTDRRKTIGGIEGALETAFPQWCVRRAFTSRKIIRRISDREGETIDTVPQAMKRAVKNGVKVLAVQPTHMTHGSEYHDLAHELVRHYWDYDGIAMGQPLLATDEDFSSVADVIVQTMSDYHRMDTAICVLTQELRSVSGDGCSKMQQVLRSTGHENYFVGPVEHAEEMLVLLGRSTYRRVLLVPLMIVIEERTRREVAGAQEDSWKSRLEDAGYEVMCLFHGLGELEQIQQIFVRHAWEAMRLLQEEYV